MFGIRITVGFVGKPQRNPARTASVQHATTTSLCDRRDALIATESKPVILYNCAWCSAMLPGGAEWEAHRKTHIENRPISEGHSAMFWYEFYRVERRR